MSGGINVGDECTLDYGDAADSLNSLLLGRQFLDEKSGELLKDLAIWTGQLHELYDRELWDPNDLDARDFVKLEIARLEGQGMQDLADKTSNVFWLLPTSFQRLIRHAERAASEDWTPGQHEAFIVFVSCWDETVWMGLEGDCEEDETRRKFYWREEQIFPWSRMMYRWWAQTCEKGKIPLPPEIWDAETKTFREDYAPPKFSEAYMLLGTQDLVQGEEVLKAPEDPEAPEAQAGDEAPQDPANSDEEAASEDEAPADVETAI